MTRIGFLCLVSCLSLCGADDKPPNAAGMLVKPYLQLGSFSRDPALALMWHTTDVEGRWAVELRQEAGDEWRRISEPQYRRIAVRSIEPHRVYSVDLIGLKPGKTFHYRVLWNGAEVFAAEAKGRKERDQSYRFTVVGDIAAQTPGQRAIAYRLAEAKADFGMVTGDIVYSRGRISEYAVKYFPIYNADTASSDAGVPLLRSMLMVAAPGNHDIASTNVSDYPDGLAYFYYWKQPLNGPLTTVGAASTPILRGEDADQKSFLTSAGSSYPQMASFSFDYANSHWTVLDSNKVVNWSDAILTKWLEEDLKSAAKADWRFVSFHHPGFNSSKAHFNDQWMRGLAPLFEKYGVDVVFNGHVHNYQRSFPMKFAPGEWNRDSGTYSGSWTLDKDFDGQKNRRPKGVLYLVTGAGGAGLYNREQESAPDSWQEFTHKFISTVHSFTAVDVDGRKATFRQISEKGDEVDKFVISK